VSAVTALLLLTLLLLYADKLQCPTVQMYHWNMYHQLST